MSAADLHGVKAAFAAMTDSELHAVSETTYEVPQVAPGLLAWIDSACVWQMRQRVGHNEELQPPEAAIPPEEDAISIEAAIALRVRFADRPAVCAMFDALVELLTGGGKRKDH
jgi:hypothetical protein